MFRPCRTLRRNVSVTRRRSLALSLSGLFPLSVTRATWFWMRSVGCGTTVAAARTLRRRWCGIDISPFAIDLIAKRRLQDPTVCTVGIPTDLVGARRLAADHPFEFETWAVSQLPGFAPNTRQRGDGGIDGRATLAAKPDDAPTRLALAQVKGGRFNASHLRDFRHVIERDNAAVGCFVTLDPAPARQRADAKLAGRVHVQGQPYDRLHLWSISEYFPDLRTPFLPVMTDPYTGRPMGQPFQAGPLCQMRWS